MIYSKFVPVCQDPLNNILAQATEDQFEAKTAFQLGHTEERGYIYTYISYIFKKQNP